MASFKPMRTDSTFQPTSIQLDRNKALRRFNWMYLYGPLLVGTLVILGLFGWMMWAVFQPETAVSSSFLSGMADIILILMLMPMLLLCVIGPAALGGLIALGYQQRKKQKESPGEPVPGGKVQKLLWQLDYTLDNLFARIYAWLPRITDPVIRFNGIIAYWQSLWHRLKNWRSSAPEDHL